MSIFTITGGVPLEGTVSVHGAKNSALPILAAAVLCPGVTVIHNCPPLSDVTASVAILEHLGAQVARQGDTLTVDATTLSTCTIPPRLMREMRSSVIFLGAILGRLGQAEMSHPGGCELGPRPIDLHLSALRTLGVEVEENAQTLRCTASRLAGGEIVLPFPSVGATENAILAAVAARGITTIRNAAREPEIEDLQNFLVSLGAGIRGGGTSVIVVEGGRPLHGGEYTVMGDRIAAATYLTAVAAAGGELELTGADPGHLTAVTAALAQAGCRVYSTGQSIHLRRTTPLRSVHQIRTAPYPGFPTDAQAPMMACLCTARGTSIIEETIFSSRYRHVEALRKMGANIQVDGQTAILTGVEKLHGEQVTARDLRGGAALVTAALGAEGVTKLEGLTHLDRGYFALENNLRALGARITRD